jgi:VIT1/CCC1 family predicted Fe2+/Mn2+ transporter
MWWVYTLGCLALYAITFQLTDFLTALVVTCAAIALFGVIVTRVSRL